MDINLDQELSAYVEQKLRTGRFVSASELVASAIRAMRKMEELETASNEELRRAAEEGLAQIERGEGEPWDVEEIKATLLAEWSQQKKAG